MTASRPGALHRLVTDHSGTAAVMFGLCLLPAIGCIGLGVDYLTGLSHKARLDAATDAAAISAITATQNYITTNGASQTDPTLTNNAMAAGTAQGAKTFTLDAGSTLNAVPTTPTVNVSRSGQTITASVTYSGQSRTTFGGLFGVKSLTIGHTAGASLTMGSYIDFYLALDVSGSMGLPTSTTDQTTLANANGGCQFACHFTGQTAGYQTARSLKIKLRVDSVGTAVANLVATAKATQTIPGQYRVGAYPFIDDAMQAAALSTDLSGTAAVGNTLGDTYLDQGLGYAPTKAMGSGGTHFETLMQDIQPYVKTFGNGSSASSPKPFLFIVTDGADNNQSFDGNNWSSGGSQPREPNNFGYCQYAQQLGVTIAILYIPYLQINNAPSGEVAEANAVNAIIPKIPPDLKACASTGFFFTANTDGDINTAMQAMFNQALQAARLTK